MKIDLSKVICLAAACLLPGTTTAERTGPGQHHGHHDFPPGVSQFHDVMAPLWHAEAGPGRVASTCAQAATLREKAQGIADAAPPAAAEDVAAWQTATRRLIEAASELESGCIDKSADVESVLAGLHHAFHDLVRLVGHRH